MGTPRCERAGVYGALRPQNAKRLSSEEGASSQPRGAPRAARGSLSEVGATASGLGQRCFLNNGLTSCFVLWAPNACCALALSGLDLSNPTSLLCDFLAAFSCFRGPRTPPPALDDVVPGAVPLPRPVGCPVRTGDKGQNAEIPGYT